MHIDFATPSGGTYNNAGSCRQLANYLEHEDLERMEKGIYIEGFFNLKDDNIYKSKLIKDMDTNIGQLLKIDAKFYAIHVSPSENELQVMGNTEQEQAEAMKRYIREVFIPEYANNFNKELSASDIKFYGKIHFDRSRSDNELNIHCHLIVSRKDQANKKKLSPLTNHKNTKNGVIKGGFDRVNLFQRTEQGFDKLFNYNRQQTESFDYYNAVKNGSLSEQLILQQKEIQSSKKETENNQICNRVNLFPSNLENKEARVPVLHPHHENNKENNGYAQNHQLGNKESKPSLGSLVPSFLLETDILSGSNIPEKQQPKSKKKKRRRL